jgi:hypothetical protein
MVITGNPEKTTSYRQDAKTAKVSNIPGEHSRAKTRCYIACGSAPGSAFRTDFLGGLGGSVLGF